MHTGFAVLLALIAVVATKFFIFPQSPQPAPKLSDVYFGPGQEPKLLDASVRPFKVVFEKQMIDDLKNRLQNTRYMQPSLEGVGWTYGVNSNFVKTFVDYWLNKYDFKKREEHLNRFPQFITNIQGLDIHFLHVKPELPKGSKIKVLPLYIQHGWPGSVVEFYKLIPLLTTPRPDQHFVFEVVAPSLPGFGFSSAAAKPGMGAIEMAHLMKNLMLRLGYDKWYAQGGDWGSIVTSNMAAMYPQHVLGLHLNMCISLAPWSQLKTTFYRFLPWLLPETEQDLIKPFGEYIHRFLTESGYFHLQATKPDTLGMATSDSPAGLATYLLEKFSSATNYENLRREDGNLYEKFDINELIDNVMFYWVPNKAVSSFRIYAESMSANSWKYRMNDVPVTVPTALAHFPKEILWQPSNTLRDRLVNLIRITRLPRGGHFAAMEEPQLLADDVWTSTKQFLEIHAKIQNQPQK